MNRRVAHADRRTPLRVNVVGSTHVGRLIGVDALSWAMIARCYLLASEGWQSGRMRRS